jgi:imidazole glycerol phosphate synthase subunit HisF
MKGKAAAVLVAGIFHFNTCSVGDMKQLFCQAKHSSEFVK